MVSLASSIFVIVSSIALLLFAVHLISKGLLLLKYTLPWLALFVIAALSAIFPEPLFALARFLGFEQPANFIFFVGLAFTMVVLLSLTVVVSWQSRYIVSLTQDLALLKYEQGLEHE